MKSAISKKRVAAAAVADKGPVQAKAKRPTTTSDEDPTRVLTYRITALNQMPWYANRDKAAEDLESLLVKNKAKWHEVAGCTPAGRAAVGAAAGFSRAARQEASHQLVRNHEAVLLDMTNRGPSTKGVVQPKLSQPTLARVEPGDARHADELLREVARRLLGANERLPQLRPSKDGGAKAAWRTGVAFLLSRIQVEEFMEQYKRGPDMSEAAADAMRGVLRELADEIA